MKDKAKKDTERAREAARMADRAKDNPEMTQEMRNIMMDRRDDKAATADRSRRRAGMKAGGAVKAYAKGGKVRGCGMAKRGVKKAKMY